MSHVDCFSAVDVPKSAVSEEHRKHYAAAVPFSLISEEMGNRLLDLT